MEGGKMIQVFKTNPMDKLESIYFKDDEEIIKDVSIFREKNTWINLTDPNDEDVAAIQPVSYTHLTLPTKLEV